MGFLWFGRKKEAHEELKNTVESIKKEFSKAGDWIKHLNSRGDKHENSLSDIGGRLSTVESDVAEIKEFLSFFGSRLFKQRQTSVYKQPVVYGVQTSVQTAVRQGFLRNLTTMERAIVWVLLNTEMKLSYEDIASLLGKDRATIRGQINSIKQKSEGLFEEEIEKTGKKRVFIPAEIKESLLKTMKIAEGREKRKKRI